MSDLTEALEWWEDTDKEEYDPHIETGMAAARKWHTLTEPTDELIERVAKALHGRMKSEFVSGWHSDYHRGLARAAVDALTVTAEPEA